MNKVILVGRLGGDVEIKVHTASGKSFATASIATDHYAGKGEDGKAIRETDWHRVVAWEDGPGYKLMGYGKKGDVVTAICELRYREREVTKKDGTTANVKDITALGVKEFEIYGKTANGSNRDADDQAAAEATKPVPKPAGKKQAPPEDDDVPF